MVDRIFLPHAPPGARRRPLGPVPGPRMPEPGRGGYKKEGSGPGGPRHRCVCLLVSRCGALPSRRPWRCPVRFPVALPGSVSVSLRFPFRRLLRRSLRSALSVAPGLAVPDLTCLPNPTRRGLPWSCPRQPPPLSLTYSSCPPGQPGAVVLVASRLHLSIPCLTEGRDRRTVAGPAPRSPGLSPIP